MTTIDHQQAAAKAIFECRGTGLNWDDPAHNDEPTRIRYRVQAQAALSAATPHLRAAWEQEMAEKIQAKFLGPDFERNPMNGQGSRDAALDAAYDEGLQTALALLEGGGACCEHSKCPGGSICCCQECGAE